MKRVGVLTALAGYIGTVFVANWLVAHYGLVDVSPGPIRLMAPAAVYAVGAALVLRDILHDLAGRHWRWWVFGGIVAGSLLSWALTDVPPGKLGGPVSLAVASGLAFALSEVLDLAIYTPLRYRSRWEWAALASSLPSLVLDSVVFLWLAFGSLAFLPGQILGKTFSVLVVVLLGWLLKPLWETDEVVVEAYS